MCLGIPMKVVELDKEFNMAVAEVSGYRREIRIDLLEDIKKGDYVIVHAGFAIQRLEEKEALETLNLINQIFEEKN